jgi:phage terminase large subunit
MLTKPTPESIEILEVFKVLFEKNKYRYKIFYGGRGGGKTLNFAIALLLIAMQRPVFILCIREIQKSIEKSVHKTLKNLIIKYKKRFGGLWDNWTITDKHIKYINGSELAFEGLRNMNEDDIKSMADVDICWVEEAQSLSYSSLRILDPTIRKEGSEIWFSFNRKTENDPVYEMFCVAVDNETYVKEINYYDNPKFPEVLEKLRLRTLKAVEDGRIDIDDYNHVWLGHPKNFSKDAYYSKYIRKTEEEGRICKGVFDTTLKVHTVWDLGVSDATAIWFFQIYGREIRLIDYYEYSGEGIQFYIDVLKEKDYNYGEHYAPHDIVVREFSTGMSRIDVAHRLGLDFNVLGVQNINTGIQLVRNNFHRCFFDAEKTQEGLKCIKNYRKEYDEKRQCYRDKPLHDWTSHGADAFRYLMQAIEYISPCDGLQRDEDEIFEEFKRKNIDNINAITGY